MIEAFIGLAGVVIGCMITVSQARNSQKEQTEKDALYLAIAVICILDEFIIDCADAVLDDGLSCGSRTKDGYLTPQYPSPGPVIYPVDVNWKSIEAELMYELLTLPVDIALADRGIDFMWNHVASPPDFDEGFEERAYEYAHFALRAQKYTKKLREDFKLPERKYEDWDPIKKIEEKLSVINKRRHLEDKTQLAFTNHRPSINN